jgi:hypothetical protein
MAPPDRDDRPRDMTPLDTAAIPADSRMRSNAEKLVSWLEWLLHPEEHDYDRTVIHYPPTGDRREVPGPVYPPTDQPGTVPSDDQLQFESVIEGYLAVDFLRAMAAVATQQVERESSPLVVGTTALCNLYYLGDEGMAALSSNFPSTWSGPASAAANDSFTTIKNVAHQISKAALDLREMPARYAAVITGLRDNANNAAGQLVEAFENRFAEHDRVNLDALGILVGAIAAASFPAIVGGATAGMIVEAAVGSVWSSSLTTVVSALGDSANAVAGNGWREIAQSYLTTQDDMLTDAKAVMDQLNGGVVGVMNFVKREEGVINEFMMSRDAHWKEI